MMLSLSKKEEEARNSRRRAFTLIELLIVVLIIAILAAIAIPNFMEFQTRAKVSRAKSDIRSIIIGMEAYRVDEGAYPIYTNGALHHWGTGEVLHQLSTPIAYLTNIPRDVFALNHAYVYDSGKGGLGSVEFASWTETFHYHVSDMLSNRTKDCYIISSIGPDQEYGYGKWGSSLGWYASQWLMEKATSSTPWTWADDPQCLSVIYDPTNGTVSWGDIHYLRGGNNIKNGFVGGGGGG
jgi:type II secretion system protein G